MHLPLKSAAAGAAVLTAGVLGAFIAAGPAAASPVTAAYTCSDGVNPTLQDQPQITLTAPASAKRGDKVAVGVSVKYNIPTPFDLPANSVNSTMRIALGSAANGTVTATGLVNVAPIPAGAPIALVEGKAELALDSAGDVTLTPEVITNTMAGSPLVVTCTPDADVPVGATIHVNPA